MEAGNNKNHKMTQNKFYNFNNLDLNNIDNIIVKWNLYLNIILDNTNLLFLLKFILNIKEKKLNIVLKISWINKYDEKIIVKLLSINLIKNVILDIVNVNDVKLFVYLIFILWKFNNIKITYIFSLLNANLLLLIFSEKLNLKNTEKITLDIEKSDNILPYIYVLNYILKLFKEEKFENYLFRNIPNCFLLNEFENISNNENNIKELNNDCYKCKLLTKCWWIWKNDLSVFPINFNIENTNINLLNKLSKSIILSNINSDTENKYPTGIDLINKKFIWTKSDFFQVIKSSNKELSLYIHIPFCVSKCNFCCCSSQEVKTENEKKEYLLKLINEIEIYWKELWNKKIKNIFFWWGTPSYYWENDLELIFSIINKYFKITKWITNISFEATESTINENKIDFLKSMWVTNISMWLQTSDKILLKNINRIQNIERFIKLSKYIKNNWITLSIDIVVWLKWDNLAKLDQTIKVIEEVWPNSMQVCRFELFWNITWDYKNYIPKYIDIHFNYVKNKLLTLWYNQLDIYDEIFYLEKSIISTYDLDILTWNTDLLWFWAFAKSKIIDKLEWENKKTYDYIKSEDLLFSNKLAIDLLENWDKDRHYIISTLDDDTFDENYLSNYSNFNIIKDETDFFIKPNNKIVLNYIYKTRLLSKVIWWLFFEESYLNKIYNQWLYNLFIDDNLDFYNYLWASLDNYDNVYPIDPILDIISEENKYSLWKSYLDENKNKKDVFHIDKLWMYIHIPFCSTLCSFCSCKTDNDLKRIDEYLETLINEIEKYWEIFKWYTFKTIYFWWGTPWILNNIQLEKLFTSLYDNFSLLNDIYISFEATPYSLNESKLKLLKSFWLKRLSMWLQSLDKNVLTNINRPQSLDSLYELFSIIRKVWIDYISVDFVAWLKWETIKTVEKMLDFVKNVKPDSVHLYQYYVDRSNSNEEYDKDRMFKIEELFYYIKKSFLELWYSIPKEHDSVFLLDSWTISNLHDYNLYKYNNSVLSLWEHSEWHIFWKLYYKNINKWIIKWKIINNINDFWIYFIKNLEFGINIIDFKEIFNEDILKIFSNEISYLLNKWFIYIENNIIKSKFNKHLDYITYYKIFWPKSEIFKQYINFLTRKKEIIDYNLFDTKPVK